MPTTRRTFMKTLGGTLLALTMLDQLPTITAHASSDDPEAIEETFVPPTYPSREDPLGSWGYVSIRWKYKGETYGNMIKVTDLTATGKEEEILSYCKEVLHDNAQIMFSRLPYEKKVTGEKTQYGSPKYATFDDVEDITYYYSPTPKSMGRLPWNTMRLGTKAATAEEALKEFSSVNTLGDVIGERK